MMFVYKHCRWPTASLTVRRPGLDLRRSGGEEEETQRRASTGKPLWKPRVFLPSYGHLVGMIWDTYFGYYGIPWDNMG